MGLGLAPRARRGRPLVLGDDGARSWDEARQGEQQLVRVAMAKAG